MKSDAANSKLETLGFGLLATMLLLIISMRLGSEDHFWRVLTGKGAWPLALLGALISLYLCFHRSLEARWGRWYTETLLGMQLLTLAGLTLIQLRLGQPDWVATPPAQGGGLVGWALAQGLWMSVGPVLAWVITLGMGIVGVFLIYRYSPLSGATLAGPASADHTAGTTHPTPTALRAASPADRSHAPPQSKPAPTPAKPAPTPAKLSPTPAKSASVPVSPAAPKQRPQPAGPTGITPPPVAVPASPPTKTPPAAPRPSASARAPASLPRRSTRLPPLELLTIEESSDATNEQAQIQAAIILDTLRSFGIPATVREINIGPTVTQFGIVPGVYERGDRTVRVRVGEITALNDDLALALSASPVRIEAPVPGRPFVGIEVPNPVTTLVSLRRVLQDRAFRKIKSPLAIPVGRDVSGATVALDLRSLPHLLIAGSTGSGKSVALNAIICALLFHNFPDTLRLILVDPKRVEFPGYNGIPHLLAPVVVDAQHATGALTWLLVEMDERYRRFAAVGVRHLASFNEQARPAERLPYIVMIVDELADLMVTSPDDIEAKLVRLAQMARATGIHLIIATQRPSVDVVTGLIKANFPARLAFSVTSQIDSRVILDTPGAEKLLGRGDGLLMTADSAKLRRIQGCFVSDSEISDLVNWWQKAQPAPPHDPTQPLYPWSQLMVEEATRSDLRQNAIDKLRGRQYISASSLQRLLGIGYPRAARLIVELEEAGVIGPEEDRRNGRRVLIEDEDE